MFDYMTAQEAAEKWEVSLRWVQRLCKENRIDGAMNINRVWLIPKEARKPADARKRKRKNLPTPPQLHIPLINYSRRCLSCRKQF